MFKYSVTVDGVQIGCESAAAAVELARAVAAGSRISGTITAVEPILPLSSTHSSDRGTSTVSEQRKDGAALLRAIADAGSRGLSAQKVVEIMRIRDGRGIGAAVAKLKREIANLGIDPELVLIKSGDHGNSRWVPGLEIESAIAKLKASGSVRSGK